MSNLAQQQSGEGVHAMNYKFTYNEFKILNTIITRNDKKDYSQRELADITDLSLGTINNLVRRLSEDGLVNKNHITEKGIVSMEPYKVRKAIFLAAGFGSRLVPITFNTPKPLVRINGTRIIDTLLDAVIKAGITDITIVRGYLSELFDQLLYKYPMIKFIENPAYLESNNISSALCVRYLLSNSYMFDSDLYLINKNLITPYQYSTNYLGVKVDKTDDWCLKVDNKGKINKMLLGGRDCYHMFGVSYWSNTDGKKMAEHIKQTYEMPGGKERFWDQVALEYFTSEYNINVRECSFNDIVEIDTFEDLKKIDPTYECNTTIKY